jgi:hypothetical protein
MALPLGTLPVTPYCGSLHVSNPIQRYPIIAIALKQIKGEWTLLWRSVALAAFGSLAMGITFAQSPKVTERMVQLERFGFIGGPCNSRQSVQFLDDERLMLSAPLVGICNKGNWSNELETQLTVIDLDGTVLATKRRSDIYAIRAGPIGYAAVCTASSLELVSGDLGTTRTIPTRPDKFSPCTDIDGISPSRTAISVRDFDESPKAFARHRLIDPKSEKPVIEQQFGKGESLAGITDSGYAVCTSAGGYYCEHLIVNGGAWRTGVSEGASRQGLFLSPNQMLFLPRWNVKTLMSLSPEGKQQQELDLRGFYPPNIDNSSIQISAANPRRILYSATGCYLGDFDDCYAFIFQQIVVFEPQTQQALFKKKVGGEATVILSPNGHTVGVLEKNKLHIYMIP